MAPETRLVISIDGGGDPECVAIAESFEWPSGQKHVIARDRNLGLREHVLACGDLTATYGPVVLLEDDVLVSPPFFQYVSDCLRWYEDEDEIAGVSLYSQRYNETARCVFEPIDNGFPVFFSQMPASWGEAFTPRQWSDFRSWLEERRGTIDNDLLPSNVALWPESSWKRLMCAYTIDTGTWFVYPYTGFSTNCGEVGVHANQAHDHLQGELASGVPATRYPTLEEGVKYDLWWEVIEHGLEWDVYGTKRYLVGDRIISSRRLPGYRQTRGYAMNLRPIQMNVYLDNEGDDFWLNERVADASSTEVEPSSQLSHRLAETRIDWVAIPHLLGIVARRLRRRIARN